MSFVGKAVKKVFSISKKIWKKTVSVAKKAWGNKWIRMAIIAAACVFTAGVAAGGFAAFTGVSSVGGFMGAVGTTMSTGWTAITGAVGLGAGAAPAAAAPLASSTVAPLVSSTVAAGGSGSALLAQAGLGVTQAALPMSAIGAGVTNTAVGAATTGTLGSRFMGSLMGNDVKGAFMRSAIVAGISSYGKKKQWDEEQKRKNNATVYGGKAFGGSADLPEGFIRKPILPGQESSPEDSTARQFAVDVPDVGAKAQTLDPRASFRNSPFSSDKQRGSGATDISTLGGVQGGALGGSDRVGLLA